MHHKKSLAILSLALLVLALSCPEARAETRVHGLKVQAPYRLSIFAEVRGARSLAPAAEIETLFVATRGEKPLRDTRKKTPCPLRKLARAERYRLAHALPVCRRAAQGCTLSLRPISTAPTRSRGSVRWLAEQKTPRLARGGDRRRRSSLYRRRRAMQHLLAERT